MPVEPSESYPRELTPSGDEAALDAIVEHELRDVLHRVPAVVALLRRMEPPPATLRDIFDAHELGPRHSRVLMVVAFHDELSVSEVAEHLDISLPAASLLVGELDRAGLLIRVEDSRDRRRTLVRVRSVYEPAALAWLEMRIAPWRATLSRLSRRDRAGFVEGWRILYSELGADL